MVANFTPVPRPAYRVGVPEWGWYRELLNSDSERYGGSNMGNGGGVHTEADPGARLRSVDLADRPAARVPVAQTVTTTNTKNTKASKLTSNNLGFVSFVTFVTFVFGVVSEQRLDFL